MSPDLLVTSRSDDAPSDLIFRGLLALPDIWRRPALILIEQDVVDFLRERRRIGRAGLVGYVHRPALLWAGGLYLAVRISRTASAIVACVEMKEASTWSGEAP